MLIAFNFKSLHLSINHKKHYGQADFQQNKSSFGRTGKDK
jgi:hypothetical protein